MLFKSNVYVSFACILESYLINFTLLLVKKFTFIYVYVPTLFAIKCDHQISLKLYINYMYNIKNTNFFFSFSQKFYTRIFQGFCEHVIYGIM